MKRLIFLPAILWATCCFSQRQNVYYLKKNGKYVKQRDSADYIRVVSEPDSASVLYNISEFYLNGKPKLTGKSKTIDPPSYEGQRLEYYASGIKKATINYKDGRKTGLEYNFYPNGKLYLLTDYNTDLDIFVADYPIISNSDSLGVVLVANGNGYAKLYSDDFKTIIEEGGVKEGKRDGAWKGVSETQKLSFKEEYKNGQLISGTAISLDGTTTTYSKTRGIPPEFKGGYTAFSQYLGSNIRYPAYERKNRIEGRVFISFVVERDGLVTDVKVTKSVSPGLDNEALRVLNEAPNWKPGIEFGRPVRVKYSVPISFKLTNY